MYNRKWGIKLRIRFAFNLKNNILKDLKIYQKFYQSRYII